MASDPIREALDIPRGAERIRLRRRSLPGDPSGRPLLLMAHGSTYPAAATFDLPVEGVSMLDALAAAGIEAWALDIVGYGDSSRPAAMRGVPEDGAPVARTADAVADVAATVDYLLERYGRSSLALLGWSWGTAIMGAYAASHPGTVGRLVQLAPLWLREGPSATDPGGPIGAYRIVDVRSVEERWTKGLSPAKAASLIPPGAVAALTEALLAADAQYSAAHPGRIRAPNGTVADTRACWSAGKPLYDAGAIRCPVLVVAGGRDREWPLGIATRYYEALTGSRDREWLVMPHATHSLLLERDRRSIYQAVIRFV